MIGIGLSARGGLGLSFTPAIIAATGLQEPGMDIPPSPQSPDPLSDVWELLGRWHPEGFAQSIDRATLDQSVIDLYFVARKWADTDILTPYLVTLERKAGLQPSSDADLRAVAAELIALDPDAASPSARRLAHGE